MSDEARHEGEREMARLLATARARRLTAFAEQMGMRTEEATAAIHRFATAFREMRAVPVEEETDDESE